MKNAGEGVDLQKGSEILKVNSPRKHLEGPWFVVYADVPNRWAIVIMHWKGKPCLGIRWFYGKQGTPSVRGFGTWLIIPNELANAILDKLPLSPKKRREVDKILIGDYSIKELQIMYK